MILYSFYSFMCALGFGIIFNIRGKRLFYAALGGGIGWFVYLFVLQFNVSATLSLFAASFAVGIYAEIMARMLRNPVTTFVVSALIPLVPGGGMYYTMLESIQGNSSHSLSLGMETIMNAGAIAVSIVLATSITRIITFYIKPNRILKSHNNQT